MGKARYKARPSVVVLALVATTLLPSVPLTPTLAATTIVSNNVDSQSTGALVPGTRANQFTGTSGSPRLSLQKTTYNSVPKALSVAISGRGTSYTYKQYSSGDTTGDLQFSLQLGRDFTLDSSGDDLILAQTVSSTSASAGTLNSILTQGRHIGLDYFDSSGTQHSLYGVKYPVSLGSWHTVELSETVGAGTGSLTLLVDGSTAVSHANLDTGSQGVTRFAVGDEFTTPTSTASRGASDPVVVAAGDIACDPGDPNYNGGTGTGISCMQRATSNELATAVAVLPLGDDQYNSGTLGMFQQVYDPTWGRYKRTTFPASGNHEYETPGAAGYYSYFGSAASPQDSNCTANCKGYYSYDLGAWHLIVLNSECDQVGGCNVGSPQEQWLKADLAAHATMCTLAYWHRPLFTSGTSLGDSAVHDLWVDLYNAHADLLLNGHDHIYERFAPQDPSGNADPTNGVTAIIVGTGGKDHGNFSSTATNSVVRDNTTFGVLKLTLHPTSVAWQFLPETAGGNGTFTDAGSRACH